MSDDLVGRDVDDLTWQDQAACKGETRLFFASPGERPEARATREATALGICANCPVRAECVDYGRVHREYGVWGETEHDRILAGHAPDMLVGSNARAESFERRGLIVR